MAVIEGYRPGGFESLPQWKELFYSQRKKDAFRDQQMETARITVLRDGSYDVTPPEMEKGARRYRLQVENGKGTVAISRNPNARLKRLLAVKDRFAQALGLPPVEFVRLSPRRMLVIADRKKPYTFLLHHDEGKDDTNAPVAPPRDRELIPMH